MLRQRVSNNIGQETILSGRLRANFCVQMHCESHMLLNETEHRLDWMVLTRVYREAWQSPPVYSAEACVHATCM